MSAFLGSMGEDRNGREERETRMFKMFGYLTGILEKREQRTWKLYGIFGLVSPVVDIFSFSVIIYIINRVAEENRASEKLTVFTLFMVVLSLMKCLFELYKSKISNRFIYDGAQKLSMKVYELMMKEDLTEHNMGGSIKLCSIAAAYGICVLKNPGPDEGLRGEKQGLFDQGQFPDYHSVRFF